ncbi:hypothetical protein AD998_16380 [bacterium 336/3]|nr:hypothetical protein AD998_16380 [bacterium 336/3]
MKKLTYFLFACLIIVQACKSKENKESSSSSSTEKKEDVKSSEPESKKGYWTTAHEEEFKKACEGEIMSLKDSPDGKTIQAAGVDIDEFAKKSCSCALDKVEKNYENIIDANKDIKGINEIGESCGKEVMIELMKKK